MKIEKIKIEGMSCSHCVASVTNALTTCGGVATVSVSLEGKCADVTYDPEKTNLSQLKEKIEDLGFDVVS